MDFQLPERTAVEIDWHDGVRLWVKTLNVWERDEAVESAGVWAGSLLGIYRDGGAGAEMVQRGFEGMDRAACLVFLDDCGAFHDVSTKEFTDGFLVDRCCVEFISRRERNLKGFRLVCETLLRAVRVADGRRTRFWKCVEDVMEVSDADRDALWGVYEGMQLAPGQVPTWAAGSPE
jgi:hypothetical protein